MAGQARKQYHAQRPHVLWSAGISRGGSRLGRRALGCTVFIVCDNARLCQRMHAVEPCRTLTMAYAYTMQTRTRRACASDPATRQSHQANPPSVRPKSHIHHAIHTVCCVCVRARMCVCACVRVCVCVRASTCTHVHVPPPPLNPNMCAACTHTGGSTAPQLTNTRVRAHRQGTGKYEGPWVPKVTDAAPPAGLRTACAPQSPARRSWGCHSARAGACQG